MLKKWCFGNRERMEKCLLKSDVLTMENTAEEMTFQQWGKMGENVADQWCFSNGEDGKNEENVAEEWCFSNGKKG
jgi:hypothetical protein